MCGNLLQWQWESNMTRIPDVQVSTFQMRRLWPSERKWLLHHHKARQWESRLRYVAASSQVGALSLHQSISKRDVCDHRTFSRRSWKAAQHDLQQEPQTKIHHGCKPWVKAACWCGEASGRNTQAVPLACRVLLGRSLMSLGLSTLMCRRKKLGHTTGSQRLPTWDLCEAWGSSPRKCSCSALTPSTWSTPFYQLPTLHLCTHFFWTKVSIVKIKIENYHLYVLNLCSSRTPRGTASTNLPSLCVQRIGPSKQDRGSSQESKST